MVEMIVETGRMKVTAIMSALTISLNATVMAGVSLELTNVMAIKIVPMGRTKQTRFVTIENATKKPSFRVKMVNVFQYYGDVILTTIVGMTVMNHLTFVVTIIAPLVGGVVLAMLIIAVFLNGYSVMERTIVGMVQMNLRKTVHHVKKRETLNVRIEDAFQNVGYVISKMIVGTTQTNKNSCALTKVIGNVLNPNFDAPMPNAFPHVGNVIMMMIVGMDQTNKIVKIILAQQKDSNARVDIVSKKS